MELSQIKTICNLGTGTMGFGTALAFASSGYSVRMYGRTDSSIARGMKSIKDALVLYRGHQLVTEDQIKQILANITGWTTLEEATKDADFVIESVVENLEVKQNLFSKVEELVRDEVILATNTSGLTPSDVATKLKRPENFVVAHFWNPPHLIPLVEIVPGKHTSQGTVDTTWKLIEKIGKKPVALHHEVPGFIGNRLQFALLREALYLVEQGIASPEAVDTAVKYSFGRRLCTTGPLESADLGGLDTFFNISSYLYADLDDTKKPSRLLCEAMDSGNYGSKTRKGIYEWTEERLNHIKANRENNLLEWLQKDQTTKF